MAVATRLRTMTATTAAVVSPPGPRMSVASAAGCRAGLQPRRCSSRCNLGKRREYSRAGLRLPLARPRYGKWSRQKKKHYDTYLKLSCLFSFFLSLSLSPPEQRPNDRGKGGRGGESEGLVCNR